VRSRLATMAARLQRDPGVVRAADLIEAVARKHDPAGAR